MYCEYCYLQNPYDFNVNNPKQKVINLWKKFFLVQKPNKRTGTFISSESYSEPTTPKQKTNVHLIRISSLCNKGEKSLQNLGVRHHVTNSKGD